MQTAIKPYIRPAIIATTAIPEDELLQPTSVIIGGQGQKGDVAEVKAWDIFPDPRENDQIAN